MDRLSRGAIFDVDGVLVDSPHEKAWRDSMRELMEDGWSEIRERTTWSPEAFTSDLYRQQIAGKPRMSGARAAMEHFHVPDDDDDHRLAEYAQRKQEVVMRLIEAGDFHAYPDAIRFLIAVKDTGIGIAAASSSKNADMLLARVPLDDYSRPGMTLFDLLDADVSGRGFAHGKPHPEIFLAAAAELGVSPRRSVVIEDAPAGITAAKAGDMAAIGIARADDADLLRKAGADIVVTSLDQVDVVALAEGLLASSG